MSTDPKFNESCEHLANMLRCAEKDRAELAGLRAVVSHCAVEIIMVQSKRFLVGKKREAERARLFALWDAGKVTASIGGGTVRFEMKPEDVFPKP